MPITIEQIKRRTNDPTYKRGLEIFRESKLFDTAQRGDGIEAYYQGTDLAPYHITAEIESDAIRATSCTCGYKRNDACKHVVALLMTYLTEPEKFVARGEREDPLLALNKEELLALVQHMVLRYPDLQNLIDNPEQSPFTPHDVDVAPYRRRWHDTLHHHLQSRHAANIAYELIEVAEKWQTQDQALSAAMLYCAMIEEALAPDHYAFDEEGALLRAMALVVEKLTETLLSAEVWQDPTSRQGVLHILLKAFIWEQNTRWDGLIDYLPEVLLAYAQPADIPQLKHSLQPLALQAQQTGKLQLANTYNNLLNYLDTLATNPAHILSHLRDKQLYLLLFARHISDNQLQEAADVVRQLMADGETVLGALNILIDLNQRTMAINIAETFLKKQMHEGVASWLLIHYRLHEQYATALKLQRQLMAHTPSLGNYRQLRELALTMGQWTDIQPKILHWLEHDKQAYEVLTEIAIDESWWAQAWGYLAKTQKTLSDWRYKELALELAEQARFAAPDEAIKVYQERIRTHIEAKKRENYQIAANLVWALRPIYEQREQLDAWEQVVEGIRQDYSRLAALQDEFDKAGL